MMKKIESKVGAIFCINRKITIGAFSL